MSPSNANVPTERDWSDCGENELDQVNAYERFHGRTREDVVSYFSEWPIGAVECLGYMPAIPFRYYVFAVGDFLMSDKVEGNFNAADAASCFLDLIEAKLKNARADVLPVINDLMPIVDYVATHQELLAADVGIYGSFPERAQRIKSLWAGQ